jgi:hypothetical protein
MKKIGWEKWVDFDFDTNSEQDEEQQIIPIMIRTPLGMFSPQEGMSPNNMFDCWIGHTNFPLTYREKDILDNIEGVEILRIMSRYRFFIGIGKLFSLTDVRPRIEIALQVGTKSKFEEISEVIGDREVWAIGIYKDGSYKAIFPKEDSDFAKDVEKLRSEGAIDIVTSENFGV